MRLGSLLPSCLFSSANSGAAPLLVGFHGYAENADIALERLQQIPGADGWRLVSVQGLHRFYRGRSELVVANWMTRQDRELAIADNLAYVSAVIGEVMPDGAEHHPLVFSGFSQGVAMAFRAACLGTHRSLGVIALGGDVPPDIEAMRLARASTVLLGRGVRDDWYTDAKFAADADRLRGSDVVVTPMSLDAGHEWTAEFAAEAGRFLTALARRA